VKQQLGNDDWITLRVTGRDDQIIAFPLRLGASAV